MQYKESNIPQVVSTDPEKLTEINLTMGDKNVLVGQDVPPEVEANLIEFLTDRLDAFAWEHEDIPWISRDVMTHKLNVDPKYAQLSNRNEGEFAPDRNQIINEEVSRLLKSWNDKGGRLPIMAC